MYRINDRREAIWEIQGYLSEIYEEENLFESGVFDEKTVELVTKFQLENSMEPSGTVDYITHREIYKSYKKTKQNKIAKNTHNLGIPFPIREGTHHSDITGINRDLAKILDKYGIHHDLRERPYFSPATSAAVKELRHIMRLKDGAEIDEELYMRMIREMK